MESHSELKKWNGMLSLLEELIKQGYKPYRNSLASKENLCDWIACKRVKEDCRWCECNHKAVQYVVTPCLYYFDDHAHATFTVSITVSITGEYDEEWWELSCYGVNEDAVSSLSKIENRLLKAWNSLGTKEESRYTKGEEYD